MLDMKNWSRGDTNPESTDEDGEDHFPCACIHVDDYANAILCWGVNDAEAAQRRDAILLAVESIAQLTAENATLRADLSDARSNWESGAEELRQADIAGVVVAEQAAPILGERITKETFQMLCYVKTWFSTALTLLPTVVWNKSGREVAEELQALLDRNFAVQLTAEEAKRLGYVAAAEAANNTINAAMSMPDLVREQLVAALKAMLETQPNANDGRAGGHQSVTAEDVAACRQARAALRAAGVTP